MSEYQESSWERTPRVEVTEPVRIISAENARVEAPEFNAPSSVDVIAVGQGQVKFGNGEKPFLTSKITQCELEIFETHTKKDPDSHKFGYMHVLSGDLTKSHRGSTTTDVLQNLSEVTHGIMVTGSKSIDDELVMSDFEELGIVTTKHISIDTIRERGNTWLHVAYRPETDEILAKVGHEDDFSVPIFVYNGFRDIPITPSVEDKSIVNRNKAIGSKILSSQYQDIANMIYNENFEDAKAMFDKVKEYGRLNNIDWTKQANGWAILEKKLKGLPPR